MGLIKKEEDAKAAEEVAEDPPIVKQLKELDGQYMEIEKEFNDAVMKLQLEYTKRQQPILDERKKMLDQGEAKTGTPALSGFWLKAIKNHPEICENIEPWDEPVLEFLSDITRVFLDEEDLEKGFKLIFTFAENPYFTNTVIEKEHIMGDLNPFNGERSCASVKTTEIEWKDGKDVTVELVTKKVKGGGAKKAKAKKAKEEPRESFFRDYFRSLFPGCPVMEDMKARMLGEMDDEDEEDDDEDMLKYLLEEDLDKGNSLADYIIPYASHWWTGEAVPEGFERDSDDEDDDDDEDEDEEESEEEESPPPKGGKKTKGKVVEKKQSGSGDASDKKQEECKQQ